MIELFKENGEKAGIYDVCQWWIQTYPEDVFISTPVQVVKIRDNMKDILKLKHVKKEEE